MTKACWQRMSSGKYLDLTDFKQEDVNIEDIEVSLNQIRRFTGHHTDEAPLTVAEHTMLCYNLARMLEPTDYELHLWVLVHDFAEAYIGDVSSPVKKAMGDRWASFATPIEETVERAFMGSLCGAEMHDRVKMYDLAALDIERRVLWSSQYGKDKWPASPLNMGSLETKRQLFDQAKGYIPLAKLCDELYSGVSE